MTSRSLYQFLLRMHPAGFRKRFEDQMLWIFDESIPTRGPVPLLVDALVSLARQWVLRSRYWRKDQLVVPAGNPADLAEQLRLHSQYQHRRAWRLNLIWMIAAFLVLMLSGLPIFSGPFFLIILPNAVGMYVRNRQGRRQNEPADAPVTLSLGDSSEEARRRYRRSIEGKRDGLLEWSHIKLSQVPWNSRLFLGGRLIFVTLSVAAVATFFKPIRPGMGFDWTAWLRFLAGFLILAVTWRFVKKSNERAAQAIQQEIDALDVPSESQPS